MKKIFLMGVPHHGNIGDSAITVAEEEMLEELFPNCKIIQFPEENLCEYTIDNKRIINNEDILLLQGGGNMGDMYSIQENGKRCVIETFPNNKIIIFPQTIFYNNKFELEKSSKIYNSHENLIIMAREQKSYDIMKKYYYNCKVYLTPDIVMTLKKTYGLKREKPLLVLRSDREKGISEITQNKIIEIIEKMYGKYNVTDTHLGHDDIDMKGELRANILNEKFKQFNSAKLVITDRLHGMIFAAITETPCVALDSGTHKTVESYKWFKELEYIEFCNDINSLEEKIKKVTSCKSINYDNSFAKDIISKILLKEIND